MVNYDNSLNSIIVARLISLTLGASTEKEIFELTSANTATVLKSHLINLRCKIR